MKAVLIDLFTSKKALATIAGVLLALTNRIGLHIDPDQLNLALGLIGAYVLGQGIADHGKAAAEVNANALVTATGAPKA